MNRLYLFLFFCFVSISLFSQDNYDENFKNKLVEFPGCENSSDKKICFSDQLSDLVVKFINSEDLQFILKNKTSDTIKINTNLYIDKYGKTDIEDSFISTVIDKKKRPLNYILSKIPILKPILDERGRGVNTKQYNILGFTISRERLMPIYGYVSPEIPFAIIENVPVYKGCNPKILDNAGLKKCMSENISKLITKNFNIKKASRGLQKGLVKIYVVFKVDITGKITDVNVRAPNKKLEKETRRVINLIPKLTKPGFQKGKPVIVPYSLPIVFRVQ